MDAREDFWLHFRFFISVNVSIIFTHSFIEERIIVFYFDFLTHNVILLHSNTDELDFFLFIVYESYFHVRALPFTVLKKKNY